MNIKNIKEKLNNNKGKIIHFKYNGARNQTEEFEGMVEETYNAIFTIRLKEDNGIKTFTYSDILIKSLELFIE